MVKTETATTRAPDTETQSPGQRIEKEYEGVLTQARILLDDPRLHTFEALLKSCLVPYKPGSSFDGNYENARQAVKKKFKKLQVDDIYFTAQQRVHVIDWMEQQMKTNPENGVLLYQMLVSAAY